MPPKQIEEELVAYVDEQLDDVAVARIERALEHDSQLRGLLSMLLRQRALLAHVSVRRKRSENRRRATPAQDSASLGEQTVRTTRLVMKKARRRNKASKVNAWLAAVAAVLIVCAYFVLTPSAQTPVQQQSAHVIKNIADDLPILAHIDGKVELPKAVAVGDQFKAGQRLRVQKDSSAQFNYADGSIIILSEESTCTIRAQKVLELENGSLSASVKRQSDGASVRVHTDFGRVQVVGTAFNIIVDNDHMDTEVTEGRVQVFRNQDATAFIVSANQRIVLKADGIEQYTSGVIAGILARDNEGFIEIKTKRGTQRYVPPWGENPNGRKGPNERVLRQLHRLRDRVGKPVTIKWTDDGEHLRVLDIIDD